MAIGISRERLADLLVDPKESLDFEVKNWLDLQDSNDDKAVLAKAVLALANHGGGFIALGLVETQSGVVEADGRPTTLNCYSQDLINGIVHNYCDPPFHCAVHIVPDPAGVLFPIVIVPGGHRVPVRARRAGPHGKIVQLNAIYIRKPGPRSETPQTSRDWDDLLARCLHNRRDEMFNRIRDLIGGAVPQIDEPAAPNRLDEWIESALERWKGLVGRLPKSCGPRFPHGYYFFAYEILGERRRVGPAQFPELLQASVVRHTGWPPFWYPTRKGIAPYPIDGTVECWLGGDTQRSVEDRDAAHSDFWRIHPDGFAFLIRGYQEDAMQAERPGRAQIEPAKAFDISLPVWRVGESMLHAQSLSARLLEGPATVRFVACYSGLAGSLMSIDRLRYVLDGRVAHQNSITLSTHVDAQSIDPNLPEIIHPLIEPLYALFDFFELPMQLVVDELARMRAGDF